VRIRWPRRARDGRDPTARLRAVLALPDSPEALPKLLAAVDDPSPDVAKAALARLPQFAGSADTKYLRQRLLEVDLAVVREWAAALRALGDEAGLLTAVSGLHSRVTGTRMPAAIALGELRDTRATTPLIRALDDPIAGVRRCALESLAMLGPDPQIEQGCQRLLFDRDPGVRGAAVHTLCAIALDLDDTLRPALRDPSAGVRSQVARHAPSLRTQTVEALLRDPVAEVRLTAAWTLTRAPRRDLLHAIADLLHDDAWQVRHAACRAATTAGHRDAVDVLIPLVADTHPTVSGGALNALEEICADDLASAIGDALPKSGPTLRRSLVYALERCPTTNVMRVLAGQVDDPDPDVRIAVAYVLGALGYKEAGGVLVVLLNDGDRAVRHAAEIAAQRIEAR
jgi:HEAT repeat protein